MRIALLGSVLAAAGIVAFLALRPSAALPQHAVLRYKFKAGETLRYTVDFDAAASLGSSERSEPIQGTGERIMRVGKVAADGTAVVTMKVDDYRDAGEAGSRLMGKRTIEFKITPRGKTAGYKLPEWEAKFPDKTNLLASISTTSPLPELPAGPVKPGASWTSSSPSPFRNSKPGTVTAVYRGTEMLRRVSTARIEQRISFPINMKGRTAGEEGKGKPISMSGSVVLKGVANLSTAQGKLIQSRLSGDGTLLVSEIGSKQPSRKIRLHIALSMHLQQ